MDNAHTCTALTRHDSGRRTRKVDNFLAVSRFIWGELFPKAIFRTTWTDTGELYLLSHLA